MTLCIAVRSFSDDVYLFSDSRFSHEVNGVMKHSDTGVKVLRIPVRILDYTTADKPLVECSFGACFSGEVESAYILQVISTQLLWRLQVNPFTGEASTDALFNLIRSIFDKVANEQCKNGYLSIRDMPQFIVAGRLPDERQIKVAKFRINDFCGLPQASYSLILSHASTITFLGSGAPIAESLFSNGVIQVETLMQKVSEIDDSVGGPLQYGSFNGSEFEVCAYAHEDDFTEKINYSYLGFEFFGETPELENSGFFAPMKALGPGAKFGGLKIDK